MPRTYLEYGLKLGAAIIIYVRVTDWKDMEALANGYETAIPNATDTFWI
jgi:hypothetical protein